MTIGQFAAQVGVSTRTIRHYEELGLLARAARLRSGYRVYGESDLERVRQIRAWTSLGLSLRQVGHLLEAGDPVQLVESQLAVTEAELARLSALRERLLRLSRSLRAGNPSALTEVLYMLEHKILLELGRDLVPLVDPAGPQPLLGALRQLRSALQAEGKLLGGIRVKDEEELAGRGFRLSIHDRRAAEGELPEGAECESLTQQLRPVLEEMED
ncbi:MAG: MerR family transcriptional regulator [Candidatus Eremiobacteraeota bacterium]|nr:MerR family transcriptional regulator [Candidatus Eremiobacteraeota bacterium]